MSSKAFSVADRIVSVDTACSVAHAEQLGLDQEAGGLTDDFLKTSDAEPSTVADFITRLLQFPLDYHVLPFPNDGGINFRGFGFEVNGGENVIISIETTDGSMGEEAVVRYSKRVSAG